MPFPTLLHMSWQILDPRSSHRARTAIPRRSGCSWPTAAGSSSMPGCTPTEDSAAGNRFAIRRQSRQVIDLDDVLESRWPATCLQLHKFACRRASTRRASISAGRVRPTISISKTCGSASRCAGTRYKPRPADLIARAVMLLTAGS